MNVNIFPFMNISILSLQYFILIGNISLEIISRIIFGNSVDSNKAQPIYLVRQLQTGLTFLIENTMFI